MNSTLTKLEFIREELTRYFLLICDYDEPDLGDDKYVTLILHHGWLCEEYVRLGGDPYEIPS